MSLSKNLKLKSNPFRMTPAIKPEEIFWAGFPEIKEKFEKRIKRSIKIKNSSLVLNWGEYGSGKTHASRYFSRKDILKNLSGQDKSPFSLVIPLPKGKDPVYQIYISIIDKLNIEELRKEVQASGGDINNYIDELGDNILMKSVLKAFFNDGIAASIIKVYLYGNANAKDMNELGESNILRKFNGDEDYTGFLAGLFSCLTSEMGLFSSIVLWIDEFEDLAILSSTNIDKANNFLRELLDNTPNNLLIFINLTQSTLFGVEDLGEYISEAVRSRIKDMIEFQLPNDTEFKKYLKDLISFYREGTDTNPYFPFDEDVVDWIIKEKEGASLRALNEAFSILLELSLIHI